MCGLPGMNAGAHPAFQGRQVGQRLKPRLDGLRPRSPLARAGNQECRCSREPPRRATDGRATGAHYSQVADQFCGVSSLSIFQAPPSLTKVRVMSMLPVAPLTEALSEDCSVADVSLTV